MGLSSRYPTGIRTRYPQNAIKTRGYANLVIWYFLIVFFKALLRYFSFLCYFP
jgi:hypothetical protein